MNDDKNPGFEAIWPGVQAEIRAARRRRKAVRIGASAGVLLLAAGLSGVVLRFAAPSVWAVNSWEVADVSAETGISADYPLARGRHIYVVHGQGDHQHIACVMKHSGALAWTNDLRFSKCRLAADDERVYLLVNADAGRWVCAALDARTGATLWREPASEIPSGLPSTLAVLPNGLCWSEGNHLIMREPATGKLVWGKSIGSGLLSAPVQGEGALIAASSDRIHALNPVTGEPLWSQALPGSSVLARFTRPMLEASGGRLFCASRNNLGKGALCCIETATRKVLWTQETEAPFKLHFHGAQVFVRSLNLDAFDAQTGAPLWQLPVGGCGTLSFHRGRVYLVDAAERARVLALDSVTGKPVWTHTVAGSCNGVVVSDRVALLSGNNRTLYAFALNGRS